MFFSRASVYVLALGSLSSAHVFLTYPGTRGDNLHTSCTPGVDDYTTGCFPYDMQWMYPCGGLTVTTNRTKWPINGGAIAFQPGWATGHSTAFIYVNMGLGTIPPNYSHPIVPVFEVVGPGNDPYPELTVCLPQVPLPASISVSPGDNATIQVIEAAKHGAALFSCVDITFTDDISEVAEVNASNCVNSSAISFNLVFATVSLTAEANSSNSSPTFWGVVSLTIAVVLGGLLL